MFKLNLKAKARPRPKRSAARADSDSELEPRHAIDAFRKGGAYSGDKAVAQAKAPLVIKTDPNDWRRRLRRRAAAGAAGTAAGAAAVAAGADNPTDDVRRALITGEDAVAADGMAITIDGSGGDDAPRYDAVPVEEFGAAMLRGMGWAGGAGAGAAAAAPPEVAHRQVGAAGIGADAVEEELATRGRVALPVRPRHS